VIALPVAHPLAARDRICFDELWDEAFVAAPAVTGWWRDYWLAADERHGHEVRVGAVTDSGQADDWLSAIANGYGIALAPESAARYFARPGVTYRALTGVSPHGRRRLVAGRRRQPLRPGFRPLLPGQPAAARHRRRPGDPLNPADWKWAPGRRELP
jgi:DNA-binding transcriptional LysR family regulator